MKGPEEAEDALPVKTAAPQEDVPDYLDSNYYWFEDNFKDNEATATATAEPEEEKENVIKKLVVQVGDTIHGKRRCAKRRPRKLNLYTEWSKKCTPTVSQQIALQWLPIKLGLSAFFESVTHVVSHKDIYFKILLNIMSVKYSTHGIKLMSKKSGVRKC